MDCELRIEDYYLGGNNLEAFYLENDISRAMAIDVTDEGRRRMWELVAHGLARVPSTTRQLCGRTHPGTGGFYFFGAHVPSRAEPLAVRALAEVIRDMEPEWVTAIEDARRLADAPEVIAAWCELPVEAVLVVLDNWSTRL